MRHLRPFAALLTIAALIVACSGPPGSSSGAGNSQAAGASQGAGASQPAASTGGGGGGGANGSAHYEISGDVTQSGDLAFTYINGGISQFVNSGWVAYFYSADQKTILQVNSMKDTHSVTFGNGDVIVVGSTDTSCTFDFSQNDASGLKGTIDCPSPIATNATGQQIHVKIHATLDAHT
jgi:hypothetical protein